jgi:DNA-directed RNA polymerase specialized sigma24 family protein
LKGDLVSNENIINELIKTEVPSQNRKKVLRAIKSLTPKQKESVFFYFYMGFNMDECRDLIGLKGKTFRVSRMKGVYMRLGAALTKIKTNTKKAKLKERVYYITHKKIGEKHDATKIRI